MVNFTMLVHNRGTLTMQALASIGFTAGVTVLADRTSDILWSDLQDWSDRGQGTLRHNGIPTGTGPLRNQVIKISENHFGRGDYLYLSDNDVFFKPGWLETLIQLYDAASYYGFKVVGAYNHPYHQHLETHAISLPGTGGHAVYEVHALALQSMLMRWEVWDKYGPFCQTPVGRVCASEDVDFARKITADSGKLGVVSPALVVNTGITNSFGEKIPGYELVKAEAPPGVLVE